MGNLFKPGDVVYASAIPSVKLIVREFTGSGYRCRVHNHPRNIEQLHAETDLVASANPTHKKRP